MKLIFGVFITVLLAVAMAFSQQYLSPIPQAAIAGEDFFSQTVARQATANSLVLEAKALCGSTPECEPWSGLLPGSMASNAASTERDIYNETVAIEANANRLVLEAKKF